MRLAGIATAAFIRTKIGKLAPGHQRFIFLRGMPIDGDDDERVCAAEDAFDTISYRKRIRNTLYLYDICAAV